MDGIKQSDHLERSTLSFPGKWITDKIGNKAFQVDNNLKENVNRKVASYTTSVQVPTTKGIIDSHLCPEDTHRTQHQLNHVLEHVALVPGTTVSSSASAVPNEILEHVAVVPVTSSFSAVPQRVLEHVTVADTLATSSGCDVAEPDKVCELDDLKTELRLLETHWKVYSRFYQTDAGQDEQEDCSEHLQHIKAEPPHDDKLYSLSAKFESLTSSHPPASPSQSDDMVSKYSCDLCMMQYPSLPLLTEHLSSHSGTQLYKCLICQKGFEEIQSLHQHMLIHTNLPVSSHGLPCATSNKVSLTGIESYYQFFSDRPTNHYQHPGKKRLHLTTLSAALSCQVCDFNCHSKDKLHQHLLSHGTVCPYACSLCDFSCASKQLLIKHMVSHMSDEDSADASNEHRSRKKRNLKKPKVLVRKDLLKPIQKVDKKTRNKEKKCLVNKSSDRNSLNVLKLETNVSSADKSSLQKCVVNIADQARYKVQFMQDDELDAAAVIANMELGEKLVETEGYGDEKSDGFDPIEEALIEGRIKDTKIPASVDDNDQTKMTLDTNTASVDDNDQTKNSEDHFLYQPDASQLSCKHCQYTCESFAYLKRHMKTHTDFEFESCPHCEFFCRTDKQLKEHMAIHSEQGADMRPFHCSRCDLSFKTRADLKRHFVTHMDINKLMCSVCSYSCSKQSRLEHHWKIHANFKPYSCAMCQFDCSSKKTLNNHVKKHSTGKQLSCRYCDFKALSQPSLKKHLKLEHVDQRPYACELCPFTCWLTNDLRKHKWIHAGIKPYQCDKCEYSCRRRNRLREHMMIHKNSKPFRCKKCSHACRTKHHLQKHFASHINEEDLRSPTGRGDTSKESVGASGQMAVSKADPLIKEEAAAENGGIESSLTKGDADNTTECCQAKQKSGEVEALNENLHVHFGTKVTKSTALQKGHSLTIEALIPSTVFKRKRNEKGRRKMNCSVCSYTCRKLSHLKRHLSTHISDRPFKCDSCDYTSKTAENLRRHAKRHSGMKPLSCKLCPYSCYELGDMNHHLLIHTDFKAYKCPQCNYAARKKYHLKEHLLTHSEVKPFLCAECGESLRSNAKLKEHMIRHTTEKNIKCSHCTFTCRRQCELGKHMRKHEDIEANNQRPFLCPECGLAFKLSFGLKQHLVTHSKEKPWSCAHCSFRCRTKGQLKSHMTIHLQGKPLLCEYCSFTSKHESSLRRHKQIHTCKDPIPCPLCSLKFVRKYDLRRHLANKHKIKINGYTLVDSLNYSNPSHADKYCENLSSASMDSTCH